MMQIAMLCGFATAYPVNWWLIRPASRKRCERAHLLQQSSLAKSSFGKTKPPRAAMRALRAWEIRRDADGLCDIRLRVQTARTEPCDSRQQSL